MEKILNSFLRKSNLLKFKLSSIYFKIGIAVFIFLALNVPIIKAQPLNANVTFTPTNTPDQVTGEFVIVLPDSTGWSAIEVELEDLINDTVLFVHEYIFDQVSGLPSGMSWLRNGNDVVLGAGILPERTVWKGRVRLKSTLNVWSNPLEFIFQ